MLDRITVHGARQHNLKNIDIEIPRNTLTVITGLSGSGKSSLAFDTIYAEGQRRYVETLSTYARQFLDQMERPDVDSIDGLSPAISIEQKTTSRSPRSTVGTITEIYDYLRLLYSSIGIPHCPVCGNEISRQTTEQILQHVLALKPEDRIMVMAPIVRGRKGEYKKDLEKLARQGFVRARIDGILRSLDEEIPLDKRKNHTIEVVVDRLLVKPGIEKRLEASIETATKLAGGLVLIVVVNGEERLYSQKLACTECGTSIPQLEPRSFSFNSPYGACEECHGLGNKWAFDPDKVIVDPGKPLFDGGMGPGGSSWNMQQQIEALAKKHRINLKKPFDSLPAKARDILLNGAGGDPGILATLQESYENTTDAYREWLTEYMSPVQCPACHGQRLRPSGLAVRVKNFSIAEFTALPLARALMTVRGWELSGREQQIAGRVQDEIRRRLEFLSAVGLDYLSLDRSAATLSGGEAQRIRLATQIGSKLRGVLYVLDEPSIGLHPRDNGRLLETLTQLRDMGNTVLVVEHDAETIERADYVIDLGPGAGRLGGGLVAQGTPEEIAGNPASLTGQYLSGTLEIPVPEERRKANGKTLAIRGATEHNLKDIDVEIPLGLLTVVTGVSGSGKSTLVNEILYRSLAREIYGSHDEPGAHDRYRRHRAYRQGDSHRPGPDRPHAALQSLHLHRAVHADPRPVRHAAGIARARVQAGALQLQREGRTLRGMPGRRVETHRDELPAGRLCDLRCVPRPPLQSRNPAGEIQRLFHRGSAGATVEEALGVMENLPQIKAKLQTLLDVGLGYVHLGQSSTTLSGGEAQRIKLAKELSKRQTGRTFYLLDEPTTGLHFDDVRKLLDVLQRLVGLGNTVVVIEHNTDVMKTADWIIDLGPDGGEYGGRVVACGTPEQVSRSKKSYTAEALRKALAGHGRAA